MGKSSIVDDNVKRKLWGAVEEALLAGWDYARLRAAMADLWIEAAKQAADDAIAETLKDRSGES